MDSILPTRAEFYMIIRLTAVVDFYLAAAQYLGWGTWLPITFAYLCFWEYMPFDRLASESDRC